MAFLEFDKLTTQTQNNMQGAHCHDHYEIYILLSGERSFIVKDKSFSVEPNCIVVVPPYTMHLTHGTAYSRVCIFLSQNLLTEAQKKLLNEIASLGTVKISEEYVVTVLQLVAEGVNLQNSPLQDKDLTQKAILDSILYFLSKQSIYLPPQKADEQDYASTAIINLCTYLNENFAKNFTIDDLCHIFFLSRATLCHNFKKLMNCTIMDYVNNLRIVNAKRLLTTTTMSMTEIAEACGFSSANYFGLIFKKYTGKSPLSFKRRGLSNIRRKQAPNEA